MKTIDWSIFDNYKYQEGDGVYLDEKSLYDGIIKTVNYKQDFVNTKHPDGEHIINAGHNKELSKMRSNSDVPCSQCHEYKLMIHTQHEGFDIIPLCSACIEN